MLALCGLMTCVVSCNYLDVVPPETVDFDDTMKDEDAALDFLYSCYAGVPTGTIFKTYISSVDEYVIPQKWDYECLTMAEGLITASNTIGPWESAYDNIGQCNLFLKQLTELNPRDVTEQQKKQWRAEVEFLMAYYHSEVLFTYGPIPLMTHYYTMNTPKSDYPGRVPFDACVDTLCKWLDHAAENLPATQPEESLGRATSTICKALKGRILLYAASPLWNGSFPYPEWTNKNGEKLVPDTYDKSKWDRALQANLEALQLAEGAGGRELFNIAASEHLREQQNVPLPNIYGVDDDFKKTVVMMRYLMNTTEIRDGNKEYIWGVQGSWDQSLTTLPHYILTRNNGNRIGGFSGLNPILYAIEHFYTMNGKLPERDNDFTDKSEWFESANIPNRGDVIKLHTYREPRFYAWIGYDGGEYSSTIVDGQPLVLHMRDGQQQGFNENLYNRDNSPTGYLCKKYISPDLTYRASDGSANNKEFKNPVIRLAELYLNIAECYAALGDTENSLKYLNVIRQRAGIPALTAADITSDMTLTDWVRNERYVELYAENLRYFDVRRWMIAPETCKTGTRQGLNAMRLNPSFKEFNQPYTLDWGFKWLTRMYLLPIAPDELYANPQLVQSPGY